MLVINTSTKGEKLGLLPLIYRVAPKKWNIHVLGYMHECYTFFRTILQFRGT